MIAAGPVMTFFSTFTFIWNLRNTLVYKLCGYIISLNDYATTYLSILPLTDI